MKDLIIFQRLKEEYGYDNPIILSEVVIEDIPKSNKRQTLKHLVDIGLLERYKNGIYYIPSKTTYGKATLDEEKVYVRKYIQNESEVYGFYAGSCFEYEIGYSTETPDILEIVTNKESTRIRTIVIGDSQIRLRKTKVEINSENARILQLLDYLNRTPLDMINKELKEKLLIYVRKQRFRYDEVLSYAKVFPSRTIRNLAGTEVIYELL